MPQLEFDELSHTYWFNGQVVPSVTRVMRPLDSYYRAAEKTLRPYAQRGTAVHELTEAYDVTGNKPLGMDPKYAGYLKAWVDFRRDHAFKPIAIEERVFHPEHLYAGTIDRVGVLRGEVAIVDIKTSAKLGPAVGVQLAAYADAWNFDPSNREANARYAVQLCEDGTYRLVEYDSPHDWPAFLGCLHIMRWQEEVKGTLKTIQFADNRPRIVQDEPEIDPTSVWSQLSRTAQRG